MFQLETEVVQELLLTFYRKKRENFIFDRNRVGQLLLEKDMLHQLQDSIEEIKKTNTPDFSAYMILLQAAHHGDDEATRVLYLIQERYPSGITQLLSDLLSDLKKFREKLSLPALFLSLHIHLFTAVFNELFFDEDDCFAVVLQCFNLNFISWPSLFSNIWSEAALCTYADSKCQEYFECSLLELLTQEDANYILNQLVEVGVEENSSVVTYHEYNHMNSAFVQVTSHQPEGQAASTQESNLPKVEPSSNELGQGIKVDKLTYILLAWFTGGVGGHYLYCKKTLKFVLSLLFFWTCIPSIMALIDIVRAILKPADADGMIEI